MSVIYVPPRGHACDLPWDRVGYGATGYSNDTVWRCDTCGRAWFSAPCYESMGPVTAWYRVRWYHRRFRSVVRK